MSKKTIQKRSLLGNLA